jgi:hypothetical protein
LSLLYSVRYKKVQMPPGSPDFVHRRPRASSDNPRLSTLRRFRKGILRPIFQVGAAGRHALPLKKDTEAPGGRVGEWTGRRESWMD